MAFRKLLDVFGQHNDDRAQGAPGDGSLGAACAVAMCLGIIALCLLYGCIDPDPFKGF